MMSFGDSKLSLKQCCLSLLFVVCCLCSALVNAQPNDTMPGTALPRIAHAGGQVDGQNYTNSIEALDFNFGLGFRFFEIDFSWTSDRQLVCLHDWEDSFERSFGITVEGAVSLQQFQALVETESEVEKCTLSSLAQWLSLHPEATLITDVKEGNLEALAHIANYYPQLIQQTIPQLYQPDEYAAVKALGFDRLIWTLYVYSGGSREVLDNLNNMDLWAITMDTTRAEQELALSLKQTGLRSYVHTINEYADYLYFMALGIEEIYTDSLSIGRQGELENSSQDSLSDSTFYKRKLEQEALRRQRRQDFLELETSLFSYTPEQLNSLEFLNQITNVAASGNGFSFTASGNDPYFRLPDLLLKKSNIQVLLQLSVEDASRVELFYTTTEQTSFSADRRVFYSTNKGANEVVLVITADSPVSSLRIDPGSLTGNYTINAIEVRAD